MGVVIYQQKKSQIFLDFFFVHRWRYLGPEDLFFSPPSIQQLFIETFFLTPIFV